MRALTTTWKNLWQQHEKVLDSFRFFAKGETNHSESTANQHSTKTSNGEKPPNSGSSLRQRIGLILGPLLFICTLLFFDPSGLSESGVAVLASTLWIATWWITEAIPIPATSLLPIILFPLTGGLDLDATTSSYGSDTIFLFMGGFIIALAMEKWGLHKRIALTIISAIGTSTERIVLGFMVATGFLSMWISNTATAMMMVPIGLAIVYQVSDSLKDNEEVDTSPENFAFGRALMLSIAYSASIGGLGTIIGTPPNTILAGFVSETYGIDLGFAQWMLFGVPLAVIFLSIAWFYLVKLAYPMKIKQLPGGREVIREERKSLGAMSTEEKVVSTIFGLAAVSWISRSFFLQEINEGIDDAVIAMTAAVLLFVIPSKQNKNDSIMDWETAKTLPWGILLLFGGGLAIAAGFTASGLAKWLGEQLTILDGVSLFFILVTAIGMVIFLTEITSNTATGTMMMPIMSSLAMAIGVHPYSLLVGAAVAASCAFMLPVATPPNAVVFGSGYLKIPDMAKAGFFLNVTAIIVLTLAIYLLLPLVWGIDLTSFPDAFR